MIDVTFYSGFSKRINSTKRPNGGTVIPLAIKEQCDFHNPTFKIQGIHGQYNYFSIGNTFYYITGEKVFPNNWIEYSGQVDAMATCADEIKNTTAFVLRSANGSLDLIDTFAPPKTVGKVLYEQEQNIFEFDNTGTFIVSLADMPRPVAMSMAQLYSLYNALNSKDATQQIENVYSDLTGYIRGAIWIPYVVPVMGTLRLKVGDYDTGLTASVIAMETETKTIFFNLPLQDTSIFSSQYCSLTLQLPYAGTLNLSIDDFRSAKSVAVIACLDTGTGAIGYYISAGSGLKPVASISGTCAVPLAIGSTSYSLGSGVSSFVAGIAYALAERSGNAFFQASHSSSQVGGGGFKTDIKTASIGIIQREPPEPLANKSSVIGLPTMRTMSLASIRGYVECRNASIESSQEPDVVAECNNYLNTGAYIE